MAASSTWPLRVKDTINGELNVERGYQARRYLGVCTAQRVCAALFFGPLVVYDWSIYVKPEGFSRVCILTRVKEALEQNKPVVALESTIILTVCLTAEP